MVASNHYSVRLPIAPQPTTQPLPRGPKFHPILSRHHATLYATMPQRIYLTEGHVRDIEQFSQGLSKDEVLAIFYRTYDDLSPDERVLFDLAYSRGRALGKNLAVGHLFNQMGGRDGVKGTLAYLVRFGDEWPEVTDEGNSKDGPVFKIVMPKKTAK